MNVERTIESRLSNQARFDARLSPLQELERARAKAAEVCRASHGPPGADARPDQPHGDSMARLGVAPRSDIRRHEPRLDAQDRKFSARLQRFDAWLCGQHPGNGSRPRA